MKLSGVTKLILTASFANTTVLAFAPNTFRISPFDINTCTAPSTDSCTHIDKRPAVFKSIFHTSSSSLALSSKPENEGGFFSDISINPIYAAFYIIFNSVAFYMVTTEAPGASQSLIDKYIADPLHPGLGSSLFETIFNMLGLIGIPFACLIMPGAKGQKLNPTPFLFGSAAAGYGSMGFVMMTRKPVTSVDKDELGWFTKNVLENKIFNWVIFIALVNTYIISGAGEGLITDFSGTFQEFLTMIKGSALATVSTVDLSILCLTGASLIPEDLERRGIDDKGKAYAIAASTLLLPTAGLALYAALRPTLKE